MTYVFELNNETSCSTVYSSYGILFEYNTALFIYRKIVIKLPWFQLENHGILVTHGQSRKKKLNFVYKIRAHNVSALHIFMSMSEINLNKYSKTY